MEIRDFCAIFLLGYLVFVIYLLIRGDRND